MIKKLVENHFAEVRKMIDMIVWVNKEFIPERGKRYAKIMFIFMVLGMVLRMIEPWIFGKIIDVLSMDSVPRWKILDFAERFIVVEDRKLLAIFVCFALFGLILLIQRNLQKWGMYFRELLFGENGRSLQLRTAELFFEKPLGLHETHSNILSEANINKGFNRIGELQKIILFWGLESILNVLMPYSAIWFINWKAALIATFMILLYVAWSIYLNQKMFEATDIIDSMWRALKRYTTERMYSVCRVKSCAKEKYEVGEIARQYDEVIKKDRKFWLWFIGCLAWRGQVNNVIFLAVFAVGVADVYAGNSTMSSLVPLYAWLSILCGNLWALGHLEHEINELTPPILSMKRALTMAPNIRIPESPIILHDDSYEIEFRNVSYSYPKSSSREETPVLDDISFVVRPGEKIALLGPSGVGKSTIIKLLMRRVDPTSGQILVNGIDLREIDIESWLEKIGYVPQDPVIFTGTLSYNILYSLSEKERNEMSDDGVHQIATIAKADFGQKLSNGYNTLVGRGGIDLSGGEKQRVMIAAAIARGRSIMLIDEATSSLDSTNERLIQEGLDRVLSSQGCSAIIVAHRLGTVRDCDRKLYLSGNGHGSKLVAEARTFEELGRIIPEFRELIVAQSVVIS